MQQESPPGWYPDHAEAWFRYWNGSAYDGPPWRPGPEELLHEVVVTQVGSRLGLRYELMKRLGIAEKQAKAYARAAPRVVAVHLPLDLARLLADALQGVGATVEIRPQYPASAVLPALAGSGGVPGRTIPPGAHPRGPPAGAGAPPGGADPRFAQVEAQYSWYRSELAAGRITPQQLDQILASLVFESGGRFWMMGANSGQWYASSGDSWVPATPPGR